MAGIDIGERTVSFVPLRVERRCKFAPLRNPVKIPVELGTELARRAAGVIEGPKDGVQVGHEDGRRNPLAADVRDGESQAAVAPLQDVVVVAPNSPGGNANRGELQALLSRKLSR